MEIKTSTVKQVQANGTHKDQYGLKYDFEIEMINGDVGQYSSKSREQDKFKQGVEVTYEFHSGKFPKIKPHYPKSGQKQPVQNDNVQLYIVRQSSLKAALDFNNITMGDSKPTISDICHDAEYFTNYVMNGLPKGEDSTSQERPDSDPLPF